MGRQAALRAFEGCRGAARGAPRRPFVTQEPGRDLGTEVEAAFVLGRQQPPSKSVTAHLCRFPPVRSR